MASSVDPSINLKGEIPHLYYFYIAETFGSFRDVSMLWLKYQARVKIVSFVVILHNIYIFFIRNVKGPWCKIWTILEAEMQTTFKPNFTRSSCFYNIEYHTYIHKPKLLYIVLDFQLNIDVIIYLFLYL